MFSDFIRHEAKARKHSFSFLAKSVGVPENTLRTWLKRNAFPDQVLMALAKHFGREPNMVKLKEDYNFTLVRTGDATRLNHPPQPEHAPKTLEDSLEYHDQRGEQLVHRLDTNFSWHIDTLFRSMHEKDLFVLYCWDDVPYEFGVSVWATFGRLIAEAAARGAYFVYLWPNIELYDFLRKAGFRPQHPEEFQRGFTAFQNAIGAIQEKSGPKNSSRNIIGIPHAEFGYTDPFTKYCVYRSANGGRGSPCRAFAHYPTGSNAVDFPINMTLGEKATTALVAFFNRILSNHPVLMDAFVWSR
ncbi:helix-turn-helix domain-containing protein [Gemmata sp. SH-PL17]|uniref:helix-turn-helix domain-containing protein n=1 Tax=Gemmata sp. SH-PL17 TaxID=1630693 RepID=UPI0009EF060A|nr:helix-turn-helix domain-containing protein [Gemmata sp. SH-PL17]